VDLTGLGSAFAPSFYWLVVMRFGVGIGVGGVPIAFSLNQEFLPTAYRGPVGMMLSMFWRCVF
jgi:MFS family permease